MKTCSFGRVHFVPYFLYLSEEEEPLEELIRKSIDRECKQHNVDVRWHGGENPYIEATDAYGFKMQQAVEDRVAVADAGTIIRNLIRRVESTKGFGRKSQDGNGMTLEDVCIEIEKSLAKCGRDGEPRVKKIRSVKMLQTWCKNNFEYPAKWEENIVKYLTEKYGIGGAR